MAIAPGGFAAHNVIRLIVFHAYSTVPDPDLEIWDKREEGGGGGGGGKSPPGGGGGGGGLTGGGGGGGGGSPKNFFRLFGPQFGLKIRGRGSSPGSATALALNKNASALAYSDTII